jgi:hypothetical protein
LFCFLATAKASFIISSADAGAFWANKDVIEPTNNKGRSSLFMALLIKSKLINAAIRTS